MIFKKHCIILPESSFTFTNSTDPDEMQHVQRFPEYKGLIKVSFCNMMI